MSALSFLAFVEPARTQTTIVRLDEQFNTGTTVDTTKWNAYDDRTPAGRTFWSVPYPNAPAPADLPQIVPEGGVTFARFTLNPYNAQHPGFFKGMEIFSRSNFIPPTTPGSFIEFTARVKGSFVPRGVVCGFYPYATIPPVGSPPKDEIDIELLGTYGADVLWLNTWNDGLSNQFTYVDSSVPLNWKQQWTKFRTRWIRESTGFRVEWYAERTSTGAMILRHSTIYRTPDHPNGMQLHFNIWAPDEAGFPQAFDSSLQPSSVPTSTRYQFDVDWATVIERNLGGAGAMGAPDFAIDTSEEPSVGASPVSLSSASAKSRTVWLVFDGALDSNFAADLTNYTLTINGKEARVQSAAYDEAGRTVGLQLPEGVVAGDTLVVGWNDLRDDKNQTLSGQTELNLE